MDRRAELGPVVWQGDRETCLAIAASAGHELLRGDGARLSPEFLFWAAMQHEGTPTGLTMLQGSAALRSEGQCQESLWPYDPNRVIDAAYGPSEAARKDGKARLVARHFIKASPSVSEIRASAAATASVLGLALTPSLFRTESDGRIRLPSPGERASGGHALLVVGYDDDARALLVRNSWGVSWGIGGYGWLPYDYPSAHLWRLWTFDALIRARRNR